ncbi:MAG: hypothetical protein HC806_00330 [Anaerolineae bacterium]|nr:hypothetical protein [Anaerolineae bacterium]
MAQYAKLRLEATPTLLDESRQAHAAYFSNFVKHLEAEFFGGQPQKAMPLFLADLANIRSAWEWAIENRQAIIFNNMSDSIMQAFDFAGLYHDAHDLALKALEALEYQPYASSMRYKPHREG